MNSKLYALCHVTVIRLFCVWRRECMVQAAVEPVYTEKKSKRKWCKKCAWKAVVNEGREKCAATRCRRQGRQPLSPTLLLLPLRRARHHAEKEGRCRCRCQTPARARRCRRLFAAKYIHTTFFTPAIRLPRRRRCHAARHYFTRHTPLRDIFTERARIATPRFRHSHAVD